VLLSPIEAAVLSLLPTGLQDLTIEPGCDVVGPADGPDSVLSGMARLQSLKYLHIKTRGISTGPLLVLHMLPLRPAAA
jgi:hypothetical protein